MRSPSGSSISPRASVALSRRWPAPASTPTPTIVAEAFREVVDPLRDTLGLGPTRSPAVVAAAIAGALALPEADGPLPTWLRPDQHRCARRLLAAVSRHRGALLAEPVGSGKTFVALAVAARLAEAPGVSIVCLVPAALREQWRRAAASAGVTIVLGSHEQASRGRLPRIDGGVVIVDESHRFRDPSTRRYAHVARWLGGRPTLLVSATPVVNRLADLAAQLLLAVRDDVLRAQGMRSLSAALARDPARDPTRERHERRAPDGEPSLAALGHLVVAGTIDAADLPARRRDEEAGRWPLAPAMRRLLVGLEALRLSTAPAVAALLRVTLLRALASSPGALSQTLRRYRRLLLHARDAAGAGRPLPRAALQRLTGDGDQLLMWELLPHERADERAAPSDLALDDLEALVRLIAEADAAAAVPDPKLDRLAALLADGRPTVVFACARETVRYLRTRLAGRIGSPAWCTGERAGIGGQTMERADVLAWFDPRTRPALEAGVPGLQPPRVLLATDVAAEGLDLHAASRVVHYDLPWTATRLDQREGRAARLGARHSSVDVVRFAPPAAIERRLRQLRLLERKARLPGDVGLDARRRELWRWRDELGTHRAESRDDTSGGIAVLRGRPARGLLVGVALAPAQGEELARLAWLDADGEVYEDGTTVASRLREAGEARGCSGEESGNVTAVSRATRARALAAAARLAREWLRSTVAELWGGAALTPAARRLAGRLDRLARGAARARDGALLAELDCALRFVTGGHTAGEALLVAELAGCSERELARRLRALPTPDPAPPPYTARLVGVVVFAP